MMPFLKLFDTDLSYDFPICFEIVDISEKKILSFSCFMRSSLIFSSVLGASIFSISNKICHICIFCTW